MQRSLSAIANCVYASRGHGSYHLDEYDRNLTMALADQIRWDKPQIWPTRSVRVEVAQDELESGAATLNLVGPDETISSALVY